MIRYRKKPVVVDAIQWKGGDTTCLDDFIGKQGWTRADAREMAYDDPEQIIVYNKAENQWIYLPVGHWVIRGVAGEYYPCKPDIFERTYDAVDYR